MVERADMLMLEIEEKMEKSLKATILEYQTIRTGRAHPALLEQISVEYYGVETPVKQISTITIPEGNQLYIKPYDKSVLKKIEYAIGTSQLGLTPQNDGIGIRLVLPKLTEERRKELSKEVEKLQEMGKVHIRNIRRDANDQIKKIELPEDAEYEYLNDIQELTNTFVQKVEDEAKLKIVEIMAI